jgi:hypothetical protein
MGLKWGAIGNSLGEHIENMMGTHWEHDPPHKEKTGPIMNAYPAFPVAAWNFSFQNCWSTIFAWAVFFSFKVGGWKWIKFFFPLFPICSHQVPKVFPNGFLKMFAIAHGFYPIWFAQSWIPLYINWNRGQYIFFNFAIGVQRGASIGGTPKVPKIVNGPIDMAPWKKKKLWAHPWTS